MTTLASFATGSTSCGGSNPFSQLSKEYHADRGVQADHYGYGAGSSTSSPQFRSQQSASAAPNTFADSFFHSSSAPSHAPPPFDLSSLSRALVPSHAPPTPSPPSDQYHAAVDSDWMNEYLAMGGGSSASVMSEGVGMQEVESARYGFGAGGGVAMPTARYQHQARAPMMMMQQGYGQNGYAMASGAAVVHAPVPSSAIDTSAWDAAFLLAHESRTPSPSHTPFSTDTSFTATTAPSAKGKARSHSPPPPPTLSTSPTPQELLHLGLLHQTLEHEPLAITYLTRATSLDPTLSSAHLALAISHANEKNLYESFRSIENWVNTLTEYTAVIQSWRETFGGEAGTEGGTLEALHEFYTGLLMRLVQFRAEEMGGGEMDAEVQIGLGVLFNSAGEFAKASDCFGAALSVRPEDPLLYNRLGATLANQGGRETEVAIQHYLEALRLSPTYVRARFNLSVAYLNLDRNEEAVSELLTSLMIQQEEPIPDSSLAPGNGRLTSETLWNSLSIAFTMMYRPDLAKLAAERNMPAILAAMPTTAQ